MLKTKVKMIVTLLVVFVVMCLLNVSTVQAVEMTETKLQEILDLIPNTMSIDIPEIEFEKANDLVENNIKKILDENQYQYEDIQYGIKLKNFDIDGYDVVIDSFASPIYTVLDEFYNAFIYIEATSGNTIHSNYTKQKTINLVYNNHSNYNKNDEKYVKELTMPNAPTYITYDFDNSIKDGVENIAFREIENYYKSQINDNTITVVADSGAAGDYVTNWGFHGINLAIFKNNVLYDIKSIGNINTICQMIVPSNKESQESYALPKIKNYLKQVYEEIGEEYDDNITLEKVNTISDCTVENGYNIVMNGEIVGEIILKVDDTEAKLQEILDLIPDTMTLDIPEIEYKKASEIIITNVKKILDTKGIKYEVIHKDEFTGNVIKLKINDSDVEIDSYSPAIYLGLDEFYTGGVIAHYNVNNGSDVLTKYNSKEIQLTYNNTNKYNTEDEQYVKNLKIENPKCFEVDLDYLLDEDVFYKHYNAIENYYTRLINDSTIEIRAEAGTSGGDPCLNITSGHGKTSFAIFKNGILYDIRQTGEDITVPVVTVPETMTDTEINDYVIKLIKDTYNEYGQCVTSITKGVEFSETYNQIPDIYTVNVSSTQFISSIIIIRKEKTVASSDEKTNIKFETTSTVVPEDTKLVVEEIKEEKTLNTIKETLKEVSDKYVVFDISLVHDNEEIQPNGKVKISIPVPTGYDASKLVVYRIEKDGSKVEFKVEVVEKENVKYAQFETDHFSNYVLAEKTVEKDNSNRVLDDQPKTGIFDMKLIIGIVMVAFTVVVVRNKRKKA